MQKLITNPNQTGIAFYNVDVKRSNAMSHNSEGWILAPSAIIFCIFKQGLSADFIDILIKKVLLQQHWGVEYLKRIDNIFSNQSFSFMFF